MEENKDELNFEEEIKRRVTENYDYNKLIIRKKSLYSYLKATVNERDNCRILDEYNKIAQRMKKAEIEATYKILVNDTTKKMGKEFEEEFDEKYNDKLMKDVYYRDQIKKRISIYDNLSKNSEYTSYLNKIIEIDIEIAGIEIDELKKVYYYYKLNIDKLNIDNETIKKFNENNINIIGELCNKSKKQLKKMKLNKEECNKVEKEIKKIGLSLKS